ncbi:phage tail protein [Lacticaseibacillus jixianensis]|uniref:Phage tail protein n=1 Tax=Lacticaseibacillus jixianensis TaxID=2486012 RepID=A0ABW4BAT0_9LACO|nr:phage tail protein [Lacticaseibacillus jixianensis]
MAYQVDYQTVSPQGLEKAADPAALAGLRANEARYFANKYKHVFTTVPAAKSRASIALVAQILKEKDFVLPYPVLETSTFTVDGIAMIYVFYQNGLVINVMYTLVAGGKRAVGIKLADGMAVPQELAAKFKFARQKSKLAGTIRGSYFVIKGEYQF